MAQATASEAQPTVTTRTKSKTGRPPGLTLVPENITAWQRMSGPAMAANWARLPAPPTEQDKIGFYAAAVPVASADIRPRIALCLLWCDADAGQYCPAYIDFYKQAFAGNKQDERAAFFITALCSGGVIEDAGLKREAFATVLAPEFAKSVYWKKFLLNADRLRMELCRIYVSEIDIMTPDRLTLIEQMLDTVSEASPDRVAFAIYIARGYRSKGRQDTNAEAVYRYVFVNAPEDMENNAFLARVYHDHQRRDSNACAIYARMASQCEAGGSVDEANRWLLRLAQTYVALGRSDESTFPVYQKARGILPNDKNLEAGYIAALMRRPLEDIDNTISELETALTQEAVLRPLFESHHWNWGLVLRALALAYGAQHRCDDTAIETFARATELCPDDQTLWEDYSRALAVRADYSAHALSVYERATAGKQPEDKLEMVLATAYLINIEQLGERRALAIQLWENLFRRGEAPPEMIDVLAQAYVEEERVNDIAILLWERVIAKDPKNGPIQLRLAQELRARSEFEKAVTYYQAAAKLLPKSFAAQYEAATLLIQQTADYPTAIKMLQKAVKLPEGEKHLGANYALGEALMARDKRDEAEKIFEHILENIDPNHTSTLLQMARLNLKYEDEGVKRAEAYYDKALNIAPDHPETYLKLAELYRERGQSDEEQKALEKYLELSPPDASKYRQLADLYIRRGDFRSAEDSLRQVITLGQADKNTYILLGEVILQARLKK